MCGKEVEVILKQSILGQNYELLTMKVSEENFDECRESSAFVDDGLVCPLEISYFLFGNR